MASHRVAHELRNEVLMSLLEDEQGKVAAMGVNQPKIQQRKTERGSKTSSR